MGVLTLNISGEMIYEGKAKKLFTTDDPDQLIQYFKDDATAFNAQKKGIIEDKGVINNSVSAILLSLLNEKGIPTHFIRKLSEREMLVKRLLITPIEVVVRNIIAGSLAKRFGLDEGKRLPVPVLEFYYKSDPLGDPMINEYHIKAMDLADDKTMESIKRYAFRINDILSAFFGKRGLLLVDIKFEFGLHNGEVMLGDEISPDTCRLWEKGTGEKMDKDRFRRDLGGVEEAYREVMKRVLN